MQLLYNFVNIMKIDLIQPRHNYAPDPKIEPIGYIGMPTALLTAAARLIKAGVQVTLHDENLRTATITSDKVGVNLVGAPYIPEVIKLQKRLQDETRNEVKLILGGAPISGLTKDQINELFGDDAINGNNDMELAQILGIESDDLVAPEKHRSSLPMKKSLMKI